MPGHWNKRKACAARGIANRSEWRISSPPRSYSIPAVAALPYHMPVALSARFDLRVEVLSSMKDLEKIHIAGHALRGERSGSKRLADPLSNPSIYAESGTRSGSGAMGLRLSLWIDGRKSPAKFDTAATTEWLTFEPGPERPASFRNLVFLW